MGRFLEAPGFLYMESEPRIIGGYKVTISRPAPLRKSLSSPELHQKHDEALERIRRFKADMKRERRKDVE